MSRNNCSCPAPGKVVSGNSVGNVLCLKGASAIGVRRASLRAILCAPWHVLSVMATMAAALFVCSFGTVNAAEVGTELQKHSVLRVCADPSNMPFSNREKEGFENKIAELLAAKLEIPLAYAWFPQTMGFVRNTLRVRRCDLIIGISSAHELVQNTNPYYASVFAAVWNTDAGYDIRSMSDDIWKENNLRIGAIAGTPPVDVLLEKNLINQLVPYHLRRAHVKHKPATQLGRDLLDKKIDVAILWGPIAGHLVKQNESALKMTTLEADNSERHRLIFPITMGIRRSEIQWRRQLNRLIRKNQDEIHAILRSYNVPIVDIP